VEGKKQTKKRIRSYLTELAAETAEADSRMRLKERSKSFLWTAIRVIWRAYSGPTAVLQRQGKQTNKQTKKTQKKCQQTSSIEYNRSCVLERGSLDGESGLEFVRLVGVLLELDDDLNKIFSNHFKDGFIVGKATQEARRSARKEQQQQNKKASSALLLQTSLGKRNRLIPG